jgi:hypothetical protein
MPLRAISPLSENRVPSGMTSNPVHKPCGVTPLGFPPINLARRPEYQLVEDLSFGMVDFEDELRPIPASQPHAVGGREEAGPAGVVGVNGRHHLLRRTDHRRCLYPHHLGLFPDAATELAVASEVVMQRMWRADEARSPEDTASGTQAS